MEPPALDRSDAQFATTRWTLVEGLHDGDEARRAEALGALCERYWPPVYAYLRRSGRRPHDAAEVTQGFFADVVIWRELFSQADRERGRLRSLVLTALKRYVVDRHRRASARGEARRVTVAEWEAEESLLGEAAGAETADSVFERRWALATVHAALRECERHYLETGKPGHWRLFERRVLAEARGHVPAPLERLAGECGFSSPASAAAAVQVVRERFRALLGEAAAAAGEDVADGHGAGGMEAVREVGSVGGSGLRGLVGPG